MRCNLSIPVSCAEIAKALGGYTTIGSTVINSISTDTRELLPGDLFIPIKGELFDGNDFCELATAKGAKVLCDRQKIADIYVESSDKVLLSLAKYYKSLLKLQYTIGITGSVGKTTTKEIIAAILRKKYKTHATKKNYNNEIGVPFTIFSAPSDCEALVVEMGTNHVGEISTLASVVRPDIAVITKIGSAHIGNFGSKKAIANEKLAILANNPEAICIVPHEEELLKSVTNKKSVSTISQNADCYLETNMRCQDGFYFDFKSIKTEIIDGFVRNNASHIPECAAMAIAACEETYVKEDHILSTLNELNISHRITKIKELRIIDDSYNSSPEAVIAAINTLASYKKPCGILLGDMLELGASAPALHREIGYAVAKANLDYLYTYGEFSEYICSGALIAGMPQDRIFKNKSMLSPEITAKQIAENQTTGHLLFKASHKINLNNVIDILKILLE